MAVFFLKFYFFFGSKRKQNAHNRFFFLNENSRVLHNLLVISMPVRPLLMPFGRLLAHVEWTNLLPRAIKRRLVTTVRRL